MMGWGKPGGSVYGQDAWGPPSWVSMFLGASGGTWESARPGGARARENGSCRAWKAGAELWGEAQKKRAAEG